jgi:shikimate dehydrogenase
VSSKTQETRHIGLIGYPVSHSLSPLIQQAAFDHLGLLGHYELWETPPDELEARIADLRWPEYRGANITVPYKEDVLPLLDRVDAEAAQIGAVNVIVNQAGMLTGYNTDAPGFMRALREEGGFDPAGCRALLLGAGGSARSVAYALVRGGISELVIANRTLDRAQYLADHLANLAPTPAPAPTYPDEDGYDADQIEADVADFSAALPLNEELQAAAAHAQHHVSVTALALADVGEYLANHGYDLLINATAIGLSPMQYDTCPIDPSLIQPQTVVFDLLYLPTRLQREASVRGARSLDGLAMLVYQGALSFELWTGQPAPLEVMFAAARGPK